MPGKIYERVEHEGSVDEPRRYRVEGPLTERREVETPWGPAWAEEGTYTFEEIVEGDGEGPMHIHTEDDFKRLYREV